MIRFREVGFFFLCSVLICLVAFRGALWGSAILAPVDIAPTIFSKYRYVDPSAGEVPANHYIIDQLTYDLPLQYTIYGAYRRGEIPWWDPDDYGGRPLLADAHVNGTDPIRLICYLTLPFVSAYNWNLILKSILTGLGMFLLLRHLHFAFSISLPLALTYQFAGCFAVFFGHPWIQASFLYYPFLWIVWSAAAKEFSWRRAGIGAAICALIFYSGNLQSHVYLLLFAVCISAAYGSVDRNALLRLLRSISFSGAIGAAFAAPVLLPQIEYYFNSVNTVHSSWSWLAGVFSLSAIFPWMLGTFRTLDLGKAIGVNGAGFGLFVGSAGFVLAALGCWKSETVLREQRGAKRTALVLVAFYLIVCSTPLLAILYTRIGPMAVMGLVILAAFGLTSLRQWHVPLPRLGLTVAVLAVAIFLMLNFAAFVVYPHYVQRVRALVAARDQVNLSFDQTPALRSFQVENLPREISVQNPETVFAFLSLIALAIYLWRRRPAPFMQWALLILNFVPIILFFVRYVPNHPALYWNRLLAGGREQRRVAQVLNPAHLRLLEEAPSFNDMLFPNDMGHLQKVHTVHGYSALQPASLVHWPPGIEPPPEPIADFMYSSNERGRSTGKLIPLTNRANARVRCEERNVSITAETLNSMMVSVAPGPSDRLLRTDTFYPGWEAQISGRPSSLEHSKFPFSAIELPGSEIALVITYVYRPSHLFAAIGLVVAAGLFVTLALVCRCEQPRSVV
jgi:hypothetical protein